MAICEGYFPVRNLTGIGAVEASAVAAPPGASMPPNLNWDALGDITQQLGLQQIGLYTPWAGRDSSMDWTEVTQPPDTNVLASGITDAQLAQAMSLTFGQPLPWIAVLSETPGELGAVEAAFSGTPYVFFQTQAVYNQNDQGEPPRIYFLHWARIRDGSDSSGGNGSLDAVASSLGGRLVFAFQVNYNNSQLRSVPTESFEQAYLAQFGPAPVLPGPEPSPLPDLPTPGPAPTAPATSSGVTLPVIGAGLVCAALGFALMRAVQKKGRR